MSGVEHAALLVGPALFGVLLIFADAAAVFAIGSALFLVSALLVSRIRGDAERVLGAEQRRPWRQEATVGLRLVASDRALRLLVGIYAALSFVGGALQVFAVTVAPDLTGLGD